MMWLCDIVTADGSVVSFSEVPSSDYTVEECVV